MGRDTFHRPGWSNTHPDPGTPPGMGYPQILNKFYLMAGQDQGTALWNTQGTATGWQLDKGVRSLLLWSCLITLKKVVSKNLDST